eukprot:347301-Pelagomonas_calceolata.AAC.1
MAGLRKASMTLQDQGADAGTQDGATSVEVRHKDFFWATLPSALDVKAEKCSQDYASQAAGCMKERHPQ